VIGCSERKSYSVGEVAAEASKMAMPAARISAQNQESSWQIRIETAEPWSELVRWVSEMLQRLISTGLAELRCAQ
jgi:hypothetical protein